VYTIDASVYISALNPAEVGSQASRDFLALVQQQQLRLFCPSLLLVEVAAAVAGALDDPQRALSLATALHDLPNQTLVPLDEALAERAAHLAAAARLRGADAVYGAVAQQYGAILATLDRRQLERLPPACKTARPADLLGELEAALHSSGRAGEGEQ
jgi:predicted nucleic acid-binding protein